MIRLMRNKDGKFETFEFKPRAINRFEDYNPSEEAYRKASICRNCKIMERVFSKGHLESWEIWPYPDEQCEFYCEAHRIFDGDTGNGVIIDECPHYEKFLSDEDLYKAYLQSDVWKAKRRRIIEQSDYRCARCGSAINLNVHHITYERLFFEDDEDLVCLCKNCHEQLHNL